MVDAQVLTLRCENCSRELAHIQFSADTDMATMGLASLSASTGDEVLAVEMKADEWRDFDGRTVVRRVSGEMDRQDLLFLKFASAETTRVELRESFADFRQRLRPGRSCYECPVCEAGRMFEVARASCDAFVRAGGKFTNRTKMAFAGSL